MPTAPTTILHNRRTPSRQPTEPLGTPGTPRLINVGAASASVALTTTCTRVSISCVGGAAFYTHAQGAALPATGLMHRINDGERLEFTVPEKTILAAIRAGVDCVLYITELT